MFGNTLLVFARIRPIPAGKTPGATHVGQSNCSVLFITFISFNGKVFHPTNRGAARKLECRTEIWTGGLEADNCSIQADESDTNRIPIPERQAPHPVHRSCLCHRHCYPCHALCFMFTTRFLCPAPAMRPATKCPCPCVWCRQVQHLRPSWAHWIIPIIIGAVAFVWLLLRLSWQSGQKTCIK